MNDVHFSGKHIVCQALPLKEREIFLRTFAVIAHGRLSVPKHPLKAEVVEAATAPAVVNVGIMYGRTMLSDERIE